MPGVITHVGWVPHAGSLHPAKIEPTSAVAWSVTGPVNRPSQLVPPSMPGGSETTRPPLPPTTWILPSISASSGPRIVPASLVIVSEPDVGPSVAERARIVALQ